MVPSDKMSAALKDGGKIAQAMLFDDGSKAYVPLDKVHDAIHDGGQLMGAAPAAPKPGMQEQPLSFTERIANNFRNDYEHIKPIATSAANDVYDVSAPNIATEVFKAVRGEPNNLKQLPPKMVLAWLQAGGVPEGELEPLAKATAPERAAAEGAPAAKAATEVVPEIARPVASTSAPAAAPAVDPAVAKHLEGAVDYTGQKPVTLSGEGALNEVLSRLPNKTQLQIARSRGIDVTAEAQLKPTSSVTARIVKKIVADYTPEELQEFHDTYLENEGRGVRNDMSQKIGKEANQVLNLQTYFPELRVPVAQQLRAQQAISNVNSTRYAPLSDLAGDLKKAAKRTAKAKPAVSAPAPASDGLLDQLNQMNELVKAGKKLQDLR